MYSSSPNFRTFLPLVALSASAGLPSAWAQNPTPAPLPQLSIKDAKVKEGNSGQTTLQFKVELRSTPTTPASVSYRTFGRTASGTTDFTNVQGVINFEAGVRTQVVTVQVKGDTKLEDNETLLVKLSGAKKLAIADGEAVGTIINDDGDYSVAPGKSKVVYASQDWFHPGLVIMNADGTNATHLTNSYYDSSPVWSPDGKKVAYRTYTELNGGFGFGLAVIDANGKNQRGVYIDNAQFPVRAQWTGDSKSLICQSSNYNGIIKVAVRDSAVTTLVASKLLYDPVVSQNTGKIVYYAMDGKTGRDQIFITDSKGQEPTQLTLDSDVSCGKPQISADGKVIVYLRYSQRTIGMYAMNSDGSNNRLLLNYQLDGVNYYIENPVLSSNGKKALLAVRHDKNITFWVADTTTNVVREVPVGPTDSINNPDFNPDGSQIVFHSTRDGNSEIYIINSDGTKRKRLTNNDFSDFEPDLTNGAVLAPITESGSGSSAAAGAASTPSSNQS